MSQLCCLDGELLKAFVVYDCSLASQAQLRLILETILQMHDFSWKQNARGDCIKLGDSIANSSTKYFLT